MESLVLVLLVLVLVLLAVVAALLVSLWRRGAQSGAALGATDVKLQLMERGLERSERGVRDDVNLQSKLLREELGGGIARLHDSLLKGTTDAARAQHEQAQRLVEPFMKAVDGLVLRLDTLNADNRAAAEKLRESVDVRLQAIQLDNAQKLETIRITVDEKLQGTLEKRLGESFALVSERLELVHKGLGEMTTLATGVGDLKKVLANVKVRGTWGEVQLGNLLEQVLTVEQFAKNVVVKPGSSERVEFALRLPGHGAHDSPVWLPIDAKYPQADYQRLVDASERGVADDVEVALKALELSLRNSARDIHSKYIAPPHTTDFAILYLPTEGLYAEAVRRVGLVDGLQSEWRVVLAGPTTLTALLNSLQMGFRTLAIQQRSSEVWSVLGAVKSEFVKFGDVLERIKKKLDEASKVVDDAGVRKRAMDKKLRDVQVLPSDAVAELPASTTADDDAS